MLHRRSILIPIHREQTGGESSIHRESFSRLDFAVRIILCLSDKRAIITHINVNLHQALDRCPVVVFYSEIYDEPELVLFSTGRLREHDEKEIIRTM
jgi:hypothetical protein